MQREESLKREISSVQDANANIIVHLTLMFKQKYRLITLSKPKLLRIKEIFRFSAKTTLMFMLSATAATIELCFARTALTKNTQITSILAANLTKNAFRISFKKR
jgi:hypothetical protein